jgi:hypothetical protein
VGVVVVVVGVVVVVVGGVVVVVGVKGIAIYRCFNF